MNAGTRYVSRSNRTRSVTRRIPTLRGTSHFGTGQGSANSPAIWCFISSLLYQCYDTLAVPASYCSPDRSTGTIDLGMVGYVDDSNGQTNAFMNLEEYPATIQNIQQSLRTNAQVWANLLGATGGALELSKCSVHARCNLDLHHTRCTSPPCRQRSF